MKAIRVGAHSLALALADIAGILLGAALAYKIIGKPNQFWIQIPLAIVITPALFWTWIAAGRRFRIHLLKPSRPNELWLWWGGSLVWAPMVFLPLHFFTQGYVSALGNLVALAVYQVLTNTAAIGLLLCLLHRTWDSPVKKQS